MGLSLVSPDGDFFCQGSRTIRVSGWGLQETRARSAIHVFVFCKFSTDEQYASRLVLNPIVMEGERPSGIIWRGYPRAALAHTRPVFLRKPQVFLRRPVIEGADILIKAYN